MGTFTWPLAFGGMVAVFGLVIWFVFQKEIRRLFDRIKGAHKTRVAMSDPSVLEAKHEESSEQES